MGEDSCTEQPKNSHLKKYEFKPGQSGNPGGRPKYKPITDALKMLLDEAYLADGTTLAQHIAQEVTKELLDPAGNLKHGYNTALLKELLDRTEGKVADTLRIEGDIPVNIVYKLTEDDGT